MKPIEKFRKRLIDNQLVVGGSVTFTDPLITDALGDCVDFIWIDLEHCYMSAESLAGHLLAAKARGIVSLVRVSGSATPYIKTVLDAGADGIIVPQVSSVDEVKAIINDCRYFPDGIRGFGPRVPSNYGRTGGRDYVEWTNKNLFVSVQIENRQAYENLDGILNLPGLDSIVIGPYDLSASLGYMGQLEHPEVVSVIKTIIKKAQKAGKFVGAGTGIDLRYANLLVEWGLQWIQVGADYNYLIYAADQIISSVRSKSTNITLKK